MPSHALPTTPVRMPTEDAVLAYLLGDYPDVDFAGGRRDVDIARLIRDGWLVATRHPDHRISLAPTRRLFDAEALGLLDHLPAGDVRAEFARHRDEDVA